VKNNIYRTRHARFTRSSRHEARWTLRPRSITAFVTRGWYRGHTKVARCTLRDVCRIGSREFRSSSGIVARHPRTPAMSFGRYRCRCWDVTSCLRCDHGSSIIDPCGTACTRVARTVYLTHTAIRPRRLMELAQREFLLPLREASSRSLRALGKAPSTPSTTLTALEIRAYVYGDAVTGSERTWCRDVRPR
jgi:hypothetical protein